MNRNKLEKAMPTALKVYEKEHGKYARLDWEQFRHFVARNATYLWFKARTKGEE